ncbi:MAG: hypothetical protein K2X74_03715, partial [Acetobacteraceae bacterium]|nr:hypothetical protein [Acetobacteraceae bacterium]
FWGQAWSGGVLENYGTIAGQRFAGVRIFNSAADNRVFNDGTITGTRGIQIDGAAATVINTGGIITNSAAFAAFDGAAATAGLTLRNAGRITAFDDAVLGSGFADRVVNTGVIDGDVLLGAGNDQYRGKHGTLLGELRGGDGNDTLIAGLGDDSVFGDKGVDRLDGGAGDDTLTGGNSNDIFVFTRAGGSDVVADFANDADDLDLTAFRFTGFAAVSSRATDVVGGLLIDLTGLGGGTAFLAGMTKALFDAGDVIL